MNMQKRVRGFLLIGLMLLSAYVAYAETVSVSTYYPSPYGNYQLMDVTGNTNLATTSGTVGVGTAAPDTTRKMHVVGSALIGAAGTSSTVGNTTIMPGTAAPASTQILFGTDGSGWQMRLGKYQAGAATPYVVIQDNGRVGVGTLTPQYVMDITGDTRISGNVVITQGGNTGNLQVGYASGNWYAVYAP